MIEAPSNNHAPRQASVAHLVLHHTAQPLDVSLDLLRYGRVSAHYVVDSNGDIYRLVDEARVAWHAGLSWWGGTRGLNATSIGIEIVNMDGNVHDYPAAQRDAVIGLCRGILGRHRGIAAHNVVGHSDIAPRRKDDPGGRFFWRALAEAGVGSWPTAVTISGAVDESALLAVLRRVGYPPPHRYGTRDGRFAALKMPVVPLEGGEPIIVDGTVIGAVGVSGVKSGEDAQVARAGVATIIPVKEAA